MLADLIRQHDNIVLSWTVMQLDHDGPNLRFKARVEFLDHFVLYVRQAIVESCAMSTECEWMS